MKEFERIAMRIENINTGTAVDQQRKDTNIARYPPRSNIHAISNVPEDTNVAFIPDKRSLPTTLDDAVQATFLKNNIHISMRQLQ